MVIRLLLWLSVLGRYGTASNLNIGVLYSPYTTAGAITDAGRQQLAAMLLAINELNDKHDGVSDDVLPLTSLRLAAQAVPNSFYGASVGSNYLSSEAFNGSGVAAVVGPDSLSLTQGSYFGLAEHGIPQLPYYVGSALFSESAYFPHFMRVAASDAIQGRVLAEIITEHFRWHKITLFFTAEAQMIRSVVEFNQAARELDLTVLSEHRLDVGMRDYSVSIRSAKKAGARIFVLFMNVADAAQLLVEGHNRKLFKSGTQILGSDVLTETSIATELTSLNASTSLLRGFLSLKQIVRIASSQVNSFMTRWKAQSDTMNASWCSNDTDDDGQSLYVANDATCAGLNFQAFADDGSDLHPAAILAYDAIHVMARALDYLMEHDIPLTRVNVYDAVTHIHYSGISGDVGYPHHDEQNEHSQGDRSKGIVYCLLNYQNDNLRRLGEWRSESGYSNCELQESNCYAIEYNTDGNTVPRDGPEPRLRDASLGLRVSIGVLSSLVMLAVVLVLGMLIVYRQTRLVKLSQPKLQLLVLFGLFLACLRSFITLFNMTSSRCIAELWLGHLAFMFVICTLLVKTWRINKLMNSGTKKVTISMHRVVAFIAGLIVLVIIELLLVFVDGVIRTKQVTVEDSQKSLVIEEKCVIVKDEFAEGLLIATETVLMLALIRVAYQSRAIPEGVSDYNRIVFIIVSILISVGVWIGILTLFEGLPVLLNFLLALLYLFVVLRVLYLLYGELVINLLRGFDLSHKFELKKKGSQYMSISNRIAPSASTTYAEETQRNDSCVDNTLTTQDAVNTEIQRLLDDIAINQTRVLELQGWSFANLMRDSDSRDKPSSNDTNTVPVPRASERSPPVVTLGTGLRNSAPFTIVNSALPGASDGFTHSTAEVVLQDPRICDSQTQQGETA